MFLFLKIKQQSLYTICQRINTDGKKEGGGLRQSPASERI